MNSIDKSEEKEESNYWNWNGFKIFWSVKGKENKHPMILLHGFGASSKHWRYNSYYFANKGYSVLINPIGQITESIPRNELNFIEFKIPNRLDNTIYSKFKDWPIIIFIAFLLIILYIFRDKNLKESSKNE